MEKKEEHPLVKEMLTPEFLKQSMNSGDLNNFIDQLFTKGVEQMLEGELDGHLCYVKHSPEGIHSGNSRNGKSTRRSIQNEASGRLKFPRIVTERSIQSWFPREAALLKASKRLSFPYMPGE